MKNKQTRILVCDDSQEIREMIGIYIRNEGWEKSFAANGNEAIEKIEKEDFNLLILDVMMPVMDGIRACIRIREFSNIPILFLTAKTEDNDKILGLSSGGDDYLSKPFNPLELVARIKAMLRRNRSYNIHYSPDTIRSEILIDELRINIGSAQVFIDGIEVKLTPTEYSIIRLLAGNRGMLFSIDRLLDAIWGDVTVSRNTAMVHIRKLREKIGDDPKNPKYIKTVWGMGYKME